MNKEYTILDHLINNTSFESNRTIDFVLFKMFLSENSWITQKSRKRELVYTRRYIVSELMKLDVPKVAIARLFKCNHATIIHHQKWHNNLVETNDKYYSHVQSEIKRKLKRFQTEMSI